MIVSTFPISDVIPKLFNNGAIKAAVVIIDTVEDP